MTDPLKTLLEDDVMARRPTPRWVWPVVLGVFALAIAIGAVWWFAVGGDSEAASTTTTSSTTTAPVADVALVAFVTEPQLLNVPTLAPEGFEVCSSSGDEVVLCNPGSATPRITISRPASPLRDTTSTGITGIRWIEGTDNAVAITFIDAGIIYTGEGVSESTLLEIVSSVPIASSDSIVVPDEPPLSMPLERAFIAGLLDIPTEQVEDRGQGHWGVRTDDFTFTYGDTSSSLGGEAEIIMSLRGVAAMLDEPTSIGDDRTLIVGYMPSASQWTAQWVQRDNTWRLYASTDAVASRDQFEELVAQVEAAIGDLP